MHLVGHVKGFLHSRRIVLSIKGNLKSFKSLKNLNLAQTTRSQPKTCTNSKNTNLNPVQITEK